METFIETEQQTELLEVVHALKTHETWSGSVVKAINKILIQAGTSFQKIIMCSTDHNLNSMGVSLPTKAC